MSEIHKELNAEAKRHHEEVAALKAEVSELTAALTELVRLKDLRNNHFKPSPDNKYPEADYDENFPLAWKAARKALSIPDSRG